MQKPRIAIGAFRPTSSRKVEGSKKNKRKKKKYQCGGTKATREGKNLGRDIEEGKNPERGREVGLEERFF